MAKHEAAMARAARSRRNLPLIEVLSGALDDDDERRRVRSVRCDFGRVVPMPTY